MGSKMRLLNIRLKEGPEGVKSELGFTYSRTGKIGF